MLLVLVWQSNGWCWTGEVGVVAIASLGSYASGAKKSLALASSSPFANHVRLGVTANRQSKGRLFGAVPLLQSSSELTLLKSVKHTEPRRSTQSSTFSVQIKYSSKITSYIDTRSS